VVLLSRPPERRSKKWSEAHTHRIGGLCGECSYGFSKEVLSETQEKNFYKIWTKVRKRNLKRDRTRKRKRRRRINNLVYDNFNFFSKKNNNFYYKDPHLATEMKDVNAPSIIRTGTCFEDDENFHNSLFFWHKISENTTYLFNFNLTNCKENSFAYIITERKSIN
jgi:hypothetical protein